MLVPICVCEIHGIRTYTRVAIITITTNEVQAKEEFEDEPIVHVHFPTLLVGDVTIFLTNIDSDDERAITDHHGITDRNDVDYNFKIDDKEDDTLKACVLVHNTGHRYCNEATVDDSEDVTEVWIRADY